MALRSSLGAAVLLLIGCSDPAASSPPPAGTATTGAGSSSGGQPGATGGATGSGGSDSGGTAPTPTAGASPGTSGAGGAANAAGTGGSEPAGGSGGEAATAGAGGQPAASGSDAFGIPFFKPSKVPGYEWNSLHWGEGDLRSITGRDPSDPTGWSIRRGDTNLMEVDGAGVMSMGGPQPRFYVQPDDGESEPFFRDIEFTGYYRRTAEDGASNSGFSVGLRAHVNGHGDVDHCLASTYYLIFRNSGTWIFDKELDHPNDSPGEGGPLFDGGGAIPVGKWIGMKYLAYNLPGDTSVKLEAYIDTESDGDVSQGVNWVKLGETVDDGNWDAPAGDCGYPDNTVVTEGGGVVFIRNTAVAKVEYTMVSWREIDGN